jgi:hypothetical protein
MHLYQLVISTIVAEVLFCIYPYMLSYNFFSFNNLMIFLASEIDYLICLYATLVYDFSTSRTVVCLFVRFVSFENCVYRKIVAKSPFSWLFYWRIYFILSHINP